jgi:hypothetical protein
VRSGTWSWFGSNLMAAARSTGVVTTDGWGVGGGGATPTVIALAVAVAALSMAIRLALTPILRCLPAI